MTEMPDGDHKPVCKAILLTPEDDLIRENRIGRFRIDEESVRRHPTELLEIFACVVVVRCEYLFDRRAYQYMALSPHFDPCSPASEAPGYVFIIGGGRPPSVRAGIFGGGVEFRKETDA